MFLISCHAEYYTNFLAAAVMANLCLSHLPMPVGYKEIAGPPSQKLQAGYIMS